MNKNLKKNLIFCAIILLVVPGTQAQQVDTSGKDLAGRKTWADSNETAFQKTQLKEQLSGCYTQWNTNTSSLTTSADLEKVKQYINQYQTCTQGTATITSTNTLDTVKQLGRCNYFWDSVDGSDQNILYFAGKKCFEELFTSDQESEGYDSTSINSQCYAYTNGSISITDEDIKTYQDQLYTCIEEAVFYMRPYPERQFYNCETACKSSADSSIFNASKQLISTEYDACFNSSDACARFTILNSKDATDPDYKTNYQACNTNNCFKTTGLAVNVSSYFTCLNACTMPDYTSTVVAGDVILKLGLSLVLLMVLL